MNLKRFVEAMEISEEKYLQMKIVEKSPHTARVVSSTDWVYNYSREQAAYPVDQSNKFYQQYQE